MLRCTKMSPGCAPQRVVSGQRESEQPSQSNGGDWPFARAGKRFGRALEVSRRQSWLEARNCWNASGRFFFLRGGLCLGY